jgi:heme/copper-type cytochrome/quinol oxidase subunit 2
MKMMKKAQVSGIQGFIMAIVGVAVMLAVGLIVLSQLQSSTTANTAEYNATGTIITKLATVPTWIGILITVALAFIVLGYFYSRG